MALLTFLLRGTNGNGRDYIALLLAEAVGLYLIAGFLGVVAGLAMSVAKSLRHLPIDAHRQE